MVVLCKTSKVLNGPGRHPLTVVGQFTETLIVFVVRGLTTNLLGLPAITALSLAAGVDATEGISQGIPRTG